MVYNYSKMLNMTQPYSDFFTNFEIDELTAQGKLFRWTILGNFSQALAGGLSMGFYSARNATVRAHNNEIYYDLYGNFRKGNSDPELLFSGDDLIVDLDNTIGPEAYALNRKSLTKRLGTDAYIVIIKEFIDMFGPFLDKLKVFVFDKEFDALQFLQGILTMALAFNIPINEIIPVAPFKGNQDYDIEGMAPLPSII